MKNETKLPIFGGNPCMDVMSSQFPKPCMVRITSINNYKIYPWIHINSILQLITFYKIVIN
jgi:hypothetical protein